MEILNKYPVKSNATASRVLQGEAVVVLPLESVVHTFDPVGTRIWELSTGNNMLANIINSIQNEFEVEANKATQDAIEFINELVSKKMLILSEIPDEC